MPSKQVGGNTGKHPLALPIFQRIVRSQGRQNVDQSIAQLVVQQTGQPARLAVKACEVRRNGQHFVTRAELPQTGSDRLLQVLVG